MFPFDSLARTITARPYRSTIFRASSILLYVRASAPAPPAFSLNRRNVSNQLMNSLCGDTPFDSCHEFGRASGNKP